MRLIIAILFASVLSISLSHQSKAMSQKDLDRINLLVNTINSEAQAVVTHGETVRGASGSLMAILQKSDVVMCAGWNIHYIRLVEAIERARVYANSSQQSNFDRAQQNLRRIQNIIERTCDQISNPEAYQDADASDPERPPKANPPTPDCDAACQRRRTAYFEAQLNQSEVRTQCSRIRGQMARVDGLGIAITQTQGDVRRSQRERDSAKRLLDRNPTSSKYLREYNRLNLEVSAYKQQVVNFRAQLSNMPNKVTLRSRLADCEQRQREANRQKRNALDNLLAYMVAKRDPNNLSGTWKMHNNTYDCVHTPENHHFVCRISEPNQNHTARGWHDGTTEYDLVIKDEMVSGKIGLAYDQEGQRKCPNYKGVSMYPVRKGRLDREHLTISGWEVLHKYLNTKECKISQSKWLSESALTKEASH